MNAQKLTDRFQSLAIMVLLVSIFSGAQAQTQAQATSKVVFSKEALGFEAKQTAGEKSFVNRFQEPQKQNSGSNKSAFFKSLLLPGWGQLSLGAKKSARTFILSEIAFLGGAIAFQRYSTWLEDDFSAVAARHAGVVNVQAKTARYWVDIGNFDSIRQFNDEKLRQRNTRDLRDPASDEFWIWDNAENRREFENLRIRRDRASERSSFAVVGVITNHLISAIHALWKSKNLQAKTSSASTKMNYRFGWQRIEQARGWGLRMKLTF